MNIRLDQLSKRFRLRESFAGHVGAVIAVDSVSLSVESGECFFLLGPSGCGKTTLLRMIAGFCSPDSGDIRFGDQIVTTLPPHRRNCGMVFQNYALWPHLTVAENIEFGLTVPDRSVPEPERRKRVRQMIETMHLEPWEKSKPTQLSGGQQQRVALARALVIEPACLLLDEPLSNLDAKLRHEMRIEIKRLIAATGITTVYVTHDQKEALSMATRCAVMRNGRVEQIGAPRELYERPANAFVADFIGGTNLIRGTVLSAEDHRVSVQTQAGVWVGEASGKTWRTGETVVVSIRPEHIRMETRAETPENAFSGRIADFLYLGDQAEYRILLPDGTELKAVELRPKPISGAPSAEIHGHVMPSDVVVLPDDHP